MQPLSDVYKAQPWIGKPWIETVFILMPPFLSLLLVIIFPGLFQNQKGVTDAGWVILILLIDVAHVYSTLYRTYFDPLSFRKQKSILTAIPFIGFVIGVLLYSVSSALFWRVLAYTAVFHFIRQQYGFMRVYSRKEINPGKWSLWIDKTVIYYATLYPLLFWHLKGPRNFNWFTDSDFLFFKSEVLLTIFTVLYVIITSVYVFSELIKWIRDRYINFPKLAVISGTCLSWYFGIVYFNGDMAFTLLNVVSHGIPYMALVWLYGEKNYSQSKRGTQFLRLIFSARGLIVFLGLLFLFAWIEEAIWDLFVWKEHSSVFGIRGMELPELSQSLLSFLVPLLALPQITHYILDGFIWKIRKEEFKWSNE